MRVFILFPLLYLCLFANAQTVPIDSLYSLIESGAQDTHQVNNLNSLVYKLQKIDVEKSNQLIEDAISLSRKLNYKKGESTSMTNKAVNNMLIGKPRDGIKYAERARELALEVDCQLCLAKACGILGGIYNGLTDNEKAMTYMVEGLKAAEASRDTHAVGLMLSNVSFILVEDENFVEAKKYLNRLGVLNQSYEDANIKLAWQLSYGIVQASEGDIAAAKDNFESAIVLANQVSNYYVLGALHEELGKIHIVENNLVKAEENILRGAEIYSKIGVEDQLMNVNVELAALYNKMGNHKKAITYSRIALDQAERSESKENKAKCYQQLSIAYENINNHKESLLFHKQYKAWSDSIFDAEKSKTILDLESKYQVTKLEERQIKNEAQIDQQRARNIISLLLLAFVSSLAFLFWNNYNTKNKYSKTLEKKVEERTTDLKDSNDQLVKSNEELERFAYISSHDLKEPLRNISSFIGLIERDVKFTEEPKLSQYLSIVQKNTKQMNRLIEDVLSYSSVNKNIETDPVDLNEVMEDVRSSLLTFITQKSALIRLHQDLPTIIANRQQIFQVFKNLIENAIKYNESDKPTIDIAYIKKGSMHHFSISDNGIGIEEDYKDKIFVMFRRLHNREKYDGTGIGLSIVKKIIESLGGSISLESEVNEGTTFRFTIPDAVV